MRSRWTMLAVLFVARATIAFQFQSVAAIAPQLSQGLGASLADIGVLIGLYFAPGALLAAFEWDLNYTGTFQPTITTATADISAAGFDGPSTRVIALRVTNSLGLTPQAYQPAYRDPVGRTVMLELRKVF